MQTVVSRALPAHPSAHTLVRTLIPVRTHAHILQLTSVAPAALGRGEMLWFPVNRNCVPATDSEAGHWKAPLNSFPPLAPTQTCLYSTFCLGDASNTGISPRHSPSSCLCSGIKYFRPICLAQPHPFPSSLGVTTLDHRHHLLLQFWQHCLPPLTLYNLCLHPYIHPESHTQTKSCPKTKSNQDPLLPKDIR